MRCASIGSSVVLSVLVLAVACSDGDTLPLDAGPAARDAALGGRDSGNDAADDGGDPGNDLPPLDVSTQHNDPQRSGQNLRETQLNPRTVSPSTFGPLRYRSVDGQVFAQPLYAGAVPQTDGTRKNVVIVATMNNVVYGFDADNEDPDPSAGVLFRLAPPALPAPIPSPHDPTDDGNLDEAVSTGILSTPVINRSTDSLYFVAVTSGEGAAWRYLLYEVDLRTGAIRRSVELHGHVTGADGKTYEFAPGDGARHLNRPGLLLANGTIYAAFGGFVDERPYRGWVLGYDTRADWSSSSEATAQFCVMPNEGGMGGIWQAGNGLAADEDGSHVYLLSGNGPYLERTGYESSFVRLDAPGLARATAWTPPDFGTLQRFDMDLGSGGVLVVPHTDYVVGGGKTGVLYVLQRDLGHVASAIQATELDPSYPPAPLPVRTDPGTGLPTTYDDASEDDAPHIHGSPIYWPSESGARVYVWGEKDRLKAYPFDPTTGALGPTPTSSRVLAPRGMPGGILSLSAAGTTAGTGIVWGMIPDSNYAPAWAPDYPMDDAHHRCGTNPRCNGEYYVVTGRLNAFDAETLELLYDGYIPKLAKFAAPTVVDGKVFVGTFDNRLLIYGLRPEQRVQISAAEGEAAERLAIAGSSVFVNRAGTLLRYTRAQGAWQPDTVARDVASDPVAQGRSVFVADALGIAEYERLDAMSPGLALRGHLPPGGSIDFTVAGDAGALRVAAVMPDGSVSITQKALGAWSSWQTVAEMPPLAPGSRVALLQVDNDWHVAGRTSSGGLAHGILGQPATFREQPSTLLTDPVLARGSRLMAYAVLADPRPVADPITEKHVIAELLAAFTIDGADVSSGDRAPFVGMRLAATPVAALAGADGTIDIWARGIDDVVEHIAWKGTHFTLWEPVVGALSRGALTASLEESGPVLAYSHPRTIDGGDRGAFAYIELGNR